MEIPKSITHPKKRLFLETYPSLLRTTKTALAIGVGEKTIYRWLESDKDFKTAMTELKKIVDGDRLEEIEKEIHTRAMEGASKQADILLMFEAKALNPDKYRERPAETRLIGDITVKMAIPPYADTPQIEPQKQLREGNATKQGEKQGKDEAS